LTCKIKAAQQRRTPKAFARTKRLIQISHEVVRECNVSSRRFDFSQKKAAVAFDRRFESFKFCQAAMTICI
jgi:hypothetical protein